jgi:glycosyltransferase involved in cell wall biosynthesis
MLRAPVFRMRNASARPATPHIVHLSTERTERGGERQLRLLHQALRQQEWRSTLLCRAQGMMARVSDDQQSIPWNGLFDLFGFLRFWGACRRHSPDILHCHDANAFTLGALIGLYTNTPVVYTRRVLFPVRSSALNHWKYGRAAYLIAISQAVEEALLQIAPYTPVQRVADGVSGQPATPEEKQAAKQRLGLKAPTLVIGSVGHFTPEKNPQLLFDLAEHLKQASRPVVVLCVGPLDEALLQRAQAIDNVIVTGLVNNALDYYPAFDFYVSTSSIEGLGSALLDAVIRDIPAFAVDSGGARDIFGTLPRLAMPGDGYDFLRMLERAIDDPEGLVSETRQLGSQTRQHFSVEKMVSGNMAVYDTILSQHVTSERKP